MNDRRLIIEAEIDFIGYVDYWRGHGHAFADPSLICCLRFGIPVSYSETIEEIIDMILEDIDRYIDPYEVVNEDLWQKFEHEIEKLERKDFEDALKALIDVEDLKQPFFEDVEVIGDENEDLELPYLLGWFHIYEAKESS